MGKKQKKEFPFKETLIFVKHSTVEPKFNVEFLEEAISFLDSLDEKSREKILYNMYKARSSEKDKQGG